MPSLAKSLKVAPITAMYVFFLSFPNSSQANKFQVGWVGTAGLMMKTQIGLGVLSFPSAFNVLGLIPGIICLLIVATITTWSGYMVGVFKINHREVYGIDDAGRLMFGRVGKEILAVTYCLCKYTTYSLFIPLANIHSLHILRRLRPHRHLHRPQCYISPRNLHCRLRRCRRSSDLLPR